MTSQDDQLPVQQCEVPGEAVSMEEPASKRFRADEDTATNSVNYQEGEKLLQQIVEEKEMKQTGKDDPDFEPQDASTTEKTDAKIEKEELADAPKPTTEEIRELKEDAQKPVEQVLNELRKCVS